MSPVWRDPTHSYVQGNLDERMIKMRFDLLLRVLLPIEVVWVMFSRFGGFRLFEIANTD